MTFALRVISLLPCMNAQHFRLELSYVDTFNKTNWHSPMLWACNNEVPRVLPRPEAWWGRCLGMNIFKTLCAYLYHRSCSVLYKSEHLCDYSRGCFDYNFELSNNFQSVELVCSKLLLLIIDYSAPACLLDYTWLKMITQMCSGEGASGTG